MTEEQFYNLLDRYAEGSCTDEEKNLVENWYNQLNEENQRAPLSEGLLLAVEDHLKTRLFEAETKPNFLLRYRYLAAASVVLILITIGIVIFKINDRPQGLLAEGSKILPGSDKAFLTLADGKRISLESATQQISQKNNTVIGNIGKGEVVFLDKTNIEARPTELNTMNVPRGGKWKVVLADGTSIWLNAATSLRFPTAFKGTTREVFLEGEAYFEVAKDAAHPFIVHSNRQTVQVLGTHFNINCYPDEKTVKTTLLEGSVRINNKISLKPGEVGRTAGDRITVEEADTEEAVAWRDNAFIFNGSELSAVMRQISRWYDVEVKFETDELKDITFSGSAPRSASIQTLLKRLSMTREVDFATDGHTIIVKPFKNK